MKKLLLLLNSAFLILHSAFAQSPLVKQWDSGIGGTDNDFLTAFQKTTDGGFILGGYTISPVGADKSQPVWGGWDYWVVKTDSLGVKQWEKDFGGTNGDQLFSLAQTRDGGYIIGGYSYSGVGGDKTQNSRGGTDYWILRLDALGTKLWDKRFGGSSDDGLTTVEQTADGGFILGGYSDSGAGGDKSQGSRGGEDYWMVKTDSLGALLWDKRFGGSGFDSFKALTQTSDGGYILIGNSASNAGGDKTQNIWGTADYWIVKTDSLGGFMWDKDFGGINSDVPNSIQQTADGGYIIGGFSNSPVGGDKTTPLQGMYDYWIIKTDSLGTFLWDKDFGGSDNEDDFGNVFITADGGFLLGGTSYSPLSGDKTENNLGPEQSWMLKTDAGGNLLWDKTLRTLSASATHDEIGLGVQTADGCYVFANFTAGGMNGDKSTPNRDATENSVDFWLIKFCDTTLVIQPTADAVASATEICQNSCISFTNYSLNATSYQWILNGATPLTSTDASPQNICYDSAGTFDVMLIATNGGGSDTLTLSNYIHVNPQPIAPVITQIGDTLFSSGGFVSYQWYFGSDTIAGATDNFYVATQSGNYNLVVTDENGCSVGAGIVNVLAYAQLAVGSMQLAIFPNPVRDELNIRSNLLNRNNATFLEVYNSLGEKIISQPMSSANCQLKTAGWNDGIYLLKISSGDKIFTKTLVKE